MFESTSDLEIIMTNAFTKALLAVKAEEQRARAAARAEAERREAEAEAAEAERRKAERGNDRTRLLRLLAMNPAGIQKQAILNEMTGRREQRHKLLAELTLSGLVHEYRAERQTFLVLAPEAASAA